MANPDNSALSSAASGASRTFDSQTQSTMAGLTSALPTSFNISNLFTTPMDRTNFLSWKSQFEDVLKLHDLGIIVKLEDKPAKNLSDGSLNPLYAKGKLVLSWIKATTSPSIKDSSHFMFDCLRSLESSRKEALSSL